MEGDTTTYLATVATQLTGYAPFWGLLALRALDFGTGLMEAFVRRQIEPAGLGKIVPDVLKIVFVCVTCIAIGAISPMLADVVTMLLVVAAVMELASITRNLHDWYVVRGVTPPAVLTALAKRLATLELAQLEPEPEASPVPPPETPDVPTDGQRATWGPFKLGGP